MPWLTGYPRDKINWGPTIVAAKCVGCGMCMNCGKGVFEWRDGKAWVARYNDCVVGCTTCARLCLGQAITFPPFDPVRETYRREGIWGKVKESLIREGKIKE